MIEVGEEGMDGTSSRGLEATSIGDRRLPQAISDRLSQHQIKIGVSVVRRMVREGEEVRVDEVTRSSYPRRRSNHHHSVEGSHRELEQRSRGPTRPTNRPAPLATTPTRPPKPPNTTSTASVRLLPSQCMRRRRGGGRSR